MNAGPAKRVGPPAESAQLASAAHLCEPLGTLILDLGARIGALDQTSRKLMGAMLQWLAEEPDDAAAIADKAIALARVQKPMVRSAELHRALTRPNARAYAPLKGGRS